MTYIKKYAGNVCVGGKNYKYLNNRGVMVYVFVSNGFGIGRSVQCRGVPSSHTNILNDRTEVCFLVSACGLTLFTLPHTGFKCMLKVNEPWYEFPTLPHFSPRIILGSYE